MCLLVMLGPDYEFVLFVLSDGGKSSYCMEARNCSEEAILTSTVYMSVSS